MVTDLLPNAKSAPWSLLALLCAAVACPSCTDTTIAINNSSTPGQICEGDFATGEPFLLCRRRSDGALGAFEVFIEQLVVRSSGEVVLAGRYVVGYAELSQTFDEFDDRSLVYWQLKANDNTLLEVQELLDQPALLQAAEDDADLADALAFIEFFVRHYFINFNTQLAQDNGRVYGTDHFIECLGEEPDAREALCYELYDLLPAQGDGSLTNSDYKTLVEILEGTTAAASVGEVDFSLEQYFACKNEEFNLDSDEPITRDCAAFDTNGSGTVDELDLTRLLEGDVPDNFPPVAFAGTDLSAAIGDLVSLNGRGSFDVETAQLDYLWEQVGGTPVNLQAAFSADATFIVPDVTIGSTLKFRLTVIDEGGAIDIDTLEVSVAGAGSAIEEPEATPPAPQVVANAGADRQITSGDFVTLDASASIGTDLDYAWSQLTGPDVTLSSTVTMQPVFTAPATAAPVVMRFQLRVTALDGGNDTDTIDLTLLPAEVTEEVVEEGGL